MNDAETQVLRELASGLELYPVDEATASLASALGRYARRVPTRHRPRPPRSGRSTVRTVAPTLVVLALAGTVGCTEVDAPDPGDTTAPTILFTVSWSRPDTPDEGGIDGLATDEERQLHRDTVVRLQALASDPESGVRVVRITGHITKVCDVGGDLREERRATVLVRKPDTEPSPPPGSVGAGLTADVDYVRCAAGDPAVSAGGRLHVEAENTAGVAAQSSRFTWTWRLP